MALSHTHQQVAQPVVLQFAEHAAAVAVVLDFFQAVEDEEDLRFLIFDLRLENWNGGLKELKHLLVRWLAIADLRGAGQPVGDGGEERVRVWGVVEGEDEEPLGDAQVGAFRHVGMRRQNFGKHSQEAVGHGRLAGSTDADQSTNPCAALGPPAADVIQLRSILPIAGAEQAVNEFASLLSHIGIRIRTREEQSTRSISRIICSLSLRGLNLYSWQLVPHR